MLCQHSMERGGGEGERGEREGGGAKYAVSAFYGERRGEGERGGGKICYVSILWSVGRFKEMEP